MSLLAIQRDMSAWLRLGSDAAAARFEAAARPGLGIYQNNYRAQLAACLEESFAVTRAWLGEDAFHRAVVDHVDRSPPASWTLDHYARGFPATLAGRYPDDAEVGDLATLELALGEAVVAPDCAAISGPGGEVDWDRARFAFVPSLALHPLSSNAPAIWSAIVAEDTPPQPVDLPSPGVLLVWRTGELCRFRAIDADEAGAIRFMMSDDARFGALCDGLDETDAARIGGWLGQWLGDGLLAAIADD